MALEHVPHPPPLLRPTAWGGPECWGVLLFPAPRDGARISGRCSVRIFGTHNLECKIFAQGSAETTMRSFYLSPSKSFKVSVDARHLLLAFGMQPSPITGSRESTYVPKSYKLIDLHDLLCDVKYEFNSDNRRLYAPSMMLLKGDV